MKAKFRNSAALVTLALIGPAAADIIYSNLQNTAIPTGTWTGVTVTVNGGTVNPFFGGVGVANDSLFQPARVGTDQLDTILNLSAGTTISSSNGTLYFSTGAGGSEDHLGSTFTAGTEGYIGFNANGDYGWMRVIFTNDTGGALVEDWAYDSAGSGGSIVVGRVRESVVDGTHNLVTLSPQSGEAFTLGSVLADHSGTVSNSVIKTGDGITTLSGTNTYTGLTTISGGTLKLGNASALGTTAGGTSITSGAVLDLNGQTIGAEAVTVNGAGISSGGALINSSGSAASLSGAVTLGSASSIGGSGNMTLGGALSGAYDLTKVGAGTVTLSGNSSSYANAIAVTAGILKLGNAGALGTTAAGTTVSSGAALDFNGQTIGGEAVTINGAGISSGGALINSSGSAASLSGAVTLGSNSSIGGSGNTTLSGGISGAHDLTKVGAGTVTLSSSNSYSGNTTVSVGTLALSGSGAIANSPVITVASGATLDVSGVSGGTWTVQGSGSSSRQTLTGSGGMTGATTIGSFGTHAPGGVGVVGTQIFSGNLNYASGSIFAWDLNANSTSMGFDMVGAGGAISVDTSSTIFRIVFGLGVDMSNAFWSTPYITQTWAMSSIFGQAISGAFQTVQTSTDVSSYGSFTISGAALTWTAVPEPTSALAGLLLAAGLLRRRR